MKTADGIPLQFRDAVTHADDTCTHLPESKEIGHARHETFVKRGHKLYDALISQSCALK